MRELFIRKLIKMVEQSDIDSLEVTTWGRSVRILKHRGNSSGPPQSAAPVTTRAAVQVTEAVAAPAPAPEPEPAKIEKKKPEGHEIKSPMVGTFYRSPSPDSKPYVEVGDTVKPGQTVCIVEAMKLMNEIEAEVAGTVTEIPVENAQPVEYGQVLFVISPS